MIRIAPAVPRDVPALVRLLALLFAQEEEFAPDAVRQRRGLLRIIRRPHTGTIFVMKDGPATVGMVSLLFTVSTVEGGPAALLEDLILDPGYRGRGLGSLLVRHVIDYARRRGISRITLLTDRTNRRALRFYRRCGFVRSSMVPLRRAVIP